MKNQLFQYKIKLVERNLKMNLTALVFGLLIFFVSTILLISLNK